MNKLLITALALLGTCTTAVAEDNKGVEPTSGGTYDLYNVGAKQFLVPRTDIWCLEERK